MRGAVYRSFPASRPFTQPRPGFTLIEVVVGVTILGMAALTFILSLVYANRLSVATAYQMSATQFLQGEIERIRSDDYKAIVPGRYADRSVASGNPVYLDAEQRVPLTVNYDILTTFSVVSGTANSARLGNIPRNAIRDGSLIPDELTSNVVVIAEGRGITQRGLVKSNTADTISITADTTGQSNEDWDFAPDSSSVIQLNMGKVVTIRVSWTINNRQYSEEMRTLVVLPLDL